MGHTYALPVIKLLFARASTCAYPGCTIPLIVIDEDRGVREVAVQIAHIRSPKPGGPRYYPDFPADELNGDENLLLLCGVHHHLIDRNDSKYAIGELMEWKEAQSAGGGGFSVQDDDIRELAARLESSLGELVEATRLQMNIRFVGGRLGWPSIPMVVAIDLAGLEEAGRKAGHLFRPGRLVGVEVENRGPVGAEVQAAGIDIDHGSARPGPWAYAYVSNYLTEWQIPCRVEGHSTRDWFETEERIRKFTLRLYGARGLVPQRFRPWAQLGNGDRLNGDWIARADLPIWEAGVGEAELRIRFGEAA